MELHTPSIHDSMQRGGGDRGQNGHQSCGNYECSCYFLLYTLFRDTPTHIHLLHTHIYIYIFEFSGSSTEISEICWPLTATENVAIESGGTFRMGAFHTSTPTTITVHNHPPCSSSLQTNFIFLSTCLPPLSHRMDRQPMDRRPMGSRRSARQIIPMALHRCI